MDAEQVSYTITLNDLASGKIDKANESAKRFEKSVHGVRGALDKLGERAVRVAETLGISYGIIKAEEFFHEGTEMAHQFDIAVGQLENTLKNVGERAGMTSRQMVALAEAEAKTLPLTKTQIVEIETALSRFGHMSPKTFQMTLEASADMSVALKRDAKEVAFSLGRIMEAPAENGRLLREFGITLTAEQRKYLLVLEHTGQVAKAQTFIFQELATKGFAGAAQAAANADPLFRYNKIMERLKYSVGGAGITILETLTPALEKVAGAVETSVSWFLKHKEVAEALAVGIGALGAAYMTFYITQKTVALGEVIINSVRSIGNAITGRQVALAEAATATNEAEAASLESLTAAQIASNAAKGASAAEGVAGAVGGAALMGSGIGEILGVTVGIGALLYGIVKILGGSNNDENSPKFLNAQKEQTRSFEDSTTSIDGFSAGIDGASNSVAVFATGLSSAIDKINKKIDTEKSTINNLKDLIRPEEYRNEDKDYVNTMIKKILPGGDIKTAIQSGTENALNKYFRNPLDKSAKELANEKEKARLEDIANSPYGATIVGNMMIRHEGTLGKLQNKKDRLTPKQNRTGGGTGIVEPTAHVTGNHPITINQKIDALIKGFTISTTNLRESTEKIKEEVVKVLLSATRDVEIVAHI